MPDTVRLDGKAISKGAAIWAITTGEMPISRVRHVNGDGKDFRWANLYVKGAMEVKPTQELLREMFAYDPETGEFLRRKNSGKGKQGFSGTVGANGYLYTCVGSKSHLIHRLIWMYVLGDFPRGTIDHINGDRTDNKWSNLRDVDRATNSQNERKARPTNKLGVMGVHRRADTGKFAAAITDPVQAKTVNLGSFDTAEEAHAAYVQAKRKLHPGCTI